MSSDMSCGCLEPSHVYQVVPVVCMYPHTSVLLALLLPPLCIHVHVYAHVSACMSEYVVCICVSVSLSYSPFYFLKAALQLGAHGFVYAGWPVSPQDPPVCLLALGLGLLGSTFAPVFDVGTEDCTQVLTSAKLALSLLSPLPTPSSFCVAHASTYGAACGFITPRISVTTQDCCTHRAMITAVLLLVLIVNCSTQVKGGFSLC